MSSADTIPLMMLALQGLALGMGIIFLSLMYALYRRAHYLKPAAGWEPNFLFVFSTLPSTSDELVGHPLG